MTEHGTGRTSDNGYDDEGTGYDPLTALQDVDDSRAAIAERLVTPWWYHPCLGLVLAALVVAVGARLPAPATLGIEAVAVVALGVLVSSYKRLTGLWVSLQSAGPRARRAWAVYAIPTVVCVLAAAALSPWLPLWVLGLLAGVVLVATVVCGRHMDDVLREEIRSGEAFATPVR